jgi:hypothetical protein
VHVASLLAAHLDITKHRDDMRAFRKSDGR